MMRTLVAVLTSFLLASSLAACGSADDGDRGTPQADLPSLVNSVTEVTRQTSAHIVMATGSREGDRELRGGIRFDGDSIEMSVSSPEGEDGAMSMIRMGDVIYLKLPGRELEPGKPWVKVDLNDPLNSLAALIGPGFGLLTETASPRANLTVSAEADGRLDATTEETLDGEPTTHYSIVANARKAFENRIATNPLLGKLTPSNGIDVALADRPNDEAPLDLWVNADGEPVRLVVETIFPDPADGPEPLNVRVDYTKWGEPVNITAPPADQVAESSDTIGDPPS